MSISAISTWDELRICSGGCEQHTLLMHEVTMLLLLLLTVHAVCLAPCCC